VRCTSSISALTPHTCPTSQKMPRGTLFHRPSSPLPTNIPPIDIKRRRKAFSFPTKPLLPLFLLFLYLLYSASHEHGQTRKWHGGHPAQDRSGSCWCGDEDGYCMCTPALSVDIVLYQRREGGGYRVWVVRRKDTGQLGTIGG
jgi:hypothetical protein